MLCYFSSHLNCIIGMSEAFKVEYTRRFFPARHAETTSRLTRPSRLQVHESKVAIEEGLMPERLSAFDRAGQVRT